MKRKLKVIIRKIKRNVRGIFNKFGKFFVSNSKKIPYKKNHSNGKNLKFLFIFIVLLFVLGFFFIRQKNNSFLNRKEDSIILNAEEINTDTNTSLKGNGFVSNSGKNNHEWLYASDTLQFDDVWNKLVLDENSTYSSLSKKEKAEWEANLLKKFDLDGFPSTISKEDSLVVGEQCGFTVEETNLMLYGTPDVVSVTKPVYSIADYFYGNGIMQVVFANSDETVKVIAFGDTDIFQVLCDNRNVLRYEIELSDGSFSTEEKEEIKQAKIESLAEKIVVEICSLQQEETDLESKDSVSSLLGEAFDNKYGSVTDIKSFSSEMLWDLVSYCLEKDNDRYSSIVNNVFTEQKINAGIISSSQELENTLETQINKETEESKRLVSITVCDQSGIPLSDQTLNGVYSYINSFDQD